LAAVAKNIYIRTNAERASGTPVAKNIYIRTNDERVASGLALVEVVNETEQVSEVIAKSLGLVRTVDDFQEVSEGVLNPRGLVRFATKEVDLIYGNGGFSAYALDADRVYYAKMTVPKYSTIKSLTIDDVDSFSGGGDDILIGIYEGTLAVPGPNLLAQSSATIVTGKNIITLDNPYAVGTQTEIWIAVYHDTGLLSIKKYPSFGAPVTQNDTATTDGLTSLPATTPATTTNGNHIALGLIIDKQEEVNLAEVNDNTVTPALPSSDTFISYASTIARASNGDIYVVGGDSGKTVVRFWKSTDGGKTFTLETDNFTETNAVRIYGVDIDSSDVIHVLFFDPVLDQIKYVTLNTGTGLFGTPEVVYDYTTLSDQPTSNNCDIAVDDNDIPHAMWYRDNIAPARDNDTVYGNRIGGSWNSITIGQRNTQGTCHGIIVNEDNIPVVVSVVSGNCYAYLGNQNDASSFTEANPGPGESGQGNIIQVNGMYIIGLTNTATGSSINDIMELPPGTDWVTGWTLYNQVVSSLEAPSKAKLGTDGENVFLVGFADRTDDLFAAFTYLERKGPGDWRPHNSYTKDQLPNRNIPSYHVWPMVTHNLNSPGEVPLLLQWTTGSADARVSILKAGITRARGLVKFAEGGFYRRTGTFGTYGANGITPIHIGMVADFVSDFDPIRVSRITYKVDALGSLSGAGTIQGIILTGASLGQAGFVEVARSAEIYNFADLSKNDILTFTFPQLPLCNDADQFIGAVGEGLTGEMGVESNRTRPPYTDNLKFRNLRNGFNWTDSIGLPSMDIFTQSESLFVEELETSFVHKKGVTTGNETIAPGSSILKGCRIFAGSPAIGKKIKDVKSQIRNRSGTQTGHMRLTIKDQFGSLKSQNVEDLDVATIPSVSTEVTIPMDTEITLAQDDTILWEDVDTAGANFMDIKYDGNDNTGVDSIFQVSGTTDPYAKVGTDRRPGMTFGLPAIANPRGLVRFAESNGFAEIDGFAMADPSDYLMGGVLRWGLTMGNVTNLRVKKVRVKLKEYTGPATGTMVMKILSGVTDALPLGSEVLEVTSNETLNYTTLTGSFVEYEFTFPDHLVTANDVVVILDSNVTGGQVSTNDTKSNGSWTNKHGSVGQFATFAWGVPGILGTPALQIEFGDDGPNISEGVLNPRGLARIIDETVNILEDVVDKLVATGLVKIVDETVQISEDQNTALGLVRIIDEIENISEALNSARNLVRIIDETENISEGIITHIGLTRVVDETLNVVENLLAVRGIVRIIDETENIQEAIDTARGQVRILDETVQISEDLINSMGLVRVLDETENIIEVVNSVRSLIRILDETVNITEQEVAVRGIVRQIDEDINILEGLVTARGIVKLADETVNIQEQVNKARGLARSIDENVNILEDVVAKKALDGIRVVNETVNVQETIIAARGIVRIIDEVLNIEEDLIRALGFIKVIDETENISEVIIATRGIVRILDETVNISEDVQIQRNKVIESIIEISEAVVTVLGRNKIINETINISETELAVRGLVRILTETEDIQEGANLARGQVRVINETINIQEGLLSIRGLVRQLDEAENISEDSLRAIGQTKVVDETVNILEDVVLAKGLTTIINETVNILEDSINAMGLTRVVDETVNIEEALNRVAGFARIIDETINILEQQVAVRGIVSQLDETLNISEVAERVSGLNRILNEEVEVQGDRLIDFNPSGFGGSHGVLGKPMWLSKFTNLPPGAVIQLIRHQTNATGPPTVAPKAYRDVGGDPGGLIGEGNSVVGPSPPGVTTAPFDILKPVVPGNGIIWLGFEGTSPNTPGITSGQPVESFLFTPDDPNAPTGKTATSGGRRYATRVQYILPEALIARIMIRVIDETENLTEQLLAVRSIIQQIDEGVNIEEAINKAVGFVKVVDEVVDIQENASIYQFIARFILEFGSKIVRQLGFSGDEQKVGTYGFFSRIRKTLDFASRRKTDI